MFLGEDLGDAAAEEVGAFRGVHDRGQQGGGHGGHGRAEVRNPAV